MILGLLECQEVTGLARVNRMFGLGIKGVSLSPGSRKITSHEISWTRCVLLKSVLPIWILEYISLALYLLCMTDLST